MKKEQKIALDFIIDKLTNSVENVQSGDRFQTEISLLNTTELKTITKKKGWNFDWKTEFRKLEREVYKLTIVNNADIIQGLVSLEVKRDYVFIHLIESSPFNIGTNKVYLGVPGN